MPMIFSNIKHSPPLEPPNTKFTNLTQNVPAMHTFSPKELLTKCNSLPANEGESPTIKSFKDSQDTFWFSELQCCLIYYDNH